MKKITLFLIFFVFVAYSVTAQKSVALHRNGTTTIFSGDTPLTDAYEASVTGDTLYVSGGNFAAPDTIDKGLIIFGAGYGVDSTAATQKTYLMYSDSLILGENTSNLYLEGLEFQGGLYRITQVAMINFTLIRCKFNSEVHFEGIPTDGAQSNASIIQCDFGAQLQLHGITYSVISNCILRGPLVYSANNVIKNNSILFGYRNDLPIVNCSSNTFQNNILSGSDYGPCKGCSLNNFQYNVIRSAGPNLGSNTTDLNNYKGVDPAVVYLNLAAGDYHLQENASATYLGDDGTEVGIYGGMLPFKEGAVPSNPHIIQKSISTTTGSNGFLNITFKVSAQQN